MDSPPSAHFISVVKKRFWALNVKLNKHFDILSSESWVGLSCYGALDTDLTGSEAVPGPEHPLKFSLVHFTLSGFIFEHISLSTQAEIHCIWNLAPPNLK